MKMPPDPPCLPATCWSLSGKGEEFTKYHKHFPASRAGAHFRCPEDWIISLKTPWPNLSPNQLRARQAAQAAVVTETSREDEPGGQLAASEELCVKITITCSSPMFCLRPAFPLPIWHFTSVSYSLWTSIRTIYLRPGGDGRKKNISATKRKWQAAGNTKKSQFLFNVT